MSTLAFDTHKAVKALKQAGFNDGQAKAVVATVGDAIGGNVATKTDIAELKADIFRHMWLMVAVIVGLTVALVKLIP